MGASQSTAEFDPGPRKRAPKAKLVHNKLVVFGENTFNQIAFLLNPVSSGSENEPILRLRVEYDPAQGNPVVGLATKEVDPGSVDILKDQDLFLWEIGKARILYRSQLQQVELPVHKLPSGTELTFQYVPAFNKVAVTFVCPGKDSLSEGFTLTDLPGHQPLLPFVGDVHTGLNSRTQFHLLDYSITLLTNNALTDMTGKVLFTTSYGVVNISSDCKSVTRTPTQQGNGCALLPIKISSGIHQWKLSVKCDFGASLCAGLVKYPFMLLDDYLKDHVKHFYRHPGLLVYRSYRGLLYQDGRQLGRSLEPLGWQHGKQVDLEFRFDSKDGTLEIMKNGRSLGIAFEGLSGIFQPVVGFYAAYEKEVRLEHYLTSEASTVQLAAPPPPKNTKNSTPIAMSIDHKGKAVGFEKDLVYGSVSISEDKKVLSREKSHSGNCLCLLNQSCDQVGTYRISFIIEYDHGASTCLGITNAKKISEVKMSTVGNVYNSPALYIYRSFQGMLYVKGKEQSKRLEEYWMSGSLVEMEIEIPSDEHCTVSFKVNAVDMGVAFSDLQRPLTPVVAFYAGMEKRVTLLHYEYTPGQHVSQPVQIFMLTHQSSEPKTELGINDVDSDKTYAAPSLLPIVCSHKDVAVYYECCLKCEEQNKNMVALPCKHATMCPKDLNLGVNAPTRHCMVCDEKILQLWNVLQPKSNT